MYVATKLRAWSENQEKLLLSRKMNSTSFRQKAIKKRMNSKLQENETWQKSLCAEQSFDNIKINISMSNAEHNSTNVNEHYIHEIVFMHICFNHLKYTKNKQLAY